jgi:hypothetical protein
MLDIFPPCRRRRPDTLCNKVTGYYVDVISAESASICLSLLLAYQFVFIPWKNKKKDVPW